jgi:hypothetical protein
MTKNIFRGDEQITDATSKLKSSIESYNNALNNINLRIVVKVYELLKGKYLLSFFVETLINLARCERLESSK